MRKKELLCQTGDESAVIPTTDELRHVAAMLSTPIDFEQLVAAGILKKRGKWWEVLDWERLPEHAGHKVQNLKLILRKKTGSYVQFGKHNSRLQNLLKKRLQLLE